jgi:DNA polymerase-3 subunit delta'
VFAKTACGVSPATIPTCSGDPRGRPRAAGRRPEKPEGGKAASRQIVIEQIRDLQQALTTGGHRGSQRVAIVDPAEAMNLYTANALLKLLEEPTTNVQFILVSSSPKRLLPTIRSRCQTWAFPRPAGELAARWLLERKTPTPSRCWPSRRHALAAAALAEGAAPRAASAS